jgi:RND family efflux transporter MFP subunit
MAVSLSGCHKEPGLPAKASLPSAPVRAVAVETKKHKALEEVMGTVRAKTRATIEAKVSGRIEQMLVNPGQQVKTGELLVQLEVKEIQAKLDQAMALRQLAERDLKRFKTLLEQEAVTQQEFDAVEARSRVAQAAVTEAETMLGYARITAPFAGVITRKLSDLGDLAYPGRPLLEIEDPSALRLEADVPEAIISRVLPGAGMSVRIASLDKELEGTVGEISPSADPNSRTFRVKLDLPPVTGLVAGQFGRVAVPVGESAALRVPASALVKRGQLEIVFVVTNQQAHLRLVKSGKRIGNEVELVSGVDAGEQVVVEGAEGLLDRQPVRVN